MMTGESRRKAPKVNLVVHGVCVEVVARLPVAYSHCHRCNPVFRESGVEKEVNRQAALEYPEGVRDEFVWLSEVIGELDRLYGSRIAIVLTDAVSLVGMYKAVRHRLRTYPAFIVNGKEVITGRDPKRLLGAVEDHLRHGTGQGAGASRRRP